MKFFILILSTLSFTTFALESSDSFDTRILKIYDKNIVVLNRGLEDGIFKNDHIKLTSSNGFIARGVCVSSSMLSSHWKIYRVIRPELVSKDTLYTLKSINQSKKPNFIENLKNIDLSKFFTDIGIKKSKKQIKFQQDRIAQYDLPNDIKSVKVEEVKKPSKVDKFIEKNFSNKKLKEDLSTFKMSVFASPMAYQTRYDQKEINYGARLYNQGSKYLFDFQYNKRERKLVDPVTELEYSSTKTQFAFDIEINRIKSYLSLISRIEYNQEIIGNTSFPEDQYQLGILGIKFHLWDNSETGSFVNISYLPSFETGSYSNTDITELNKREGFRQFIRLSSKINVDKNFNLSLNYLSGVFTLMSSTDLDYEDRYQKTDLTLSYKISESFYWDYLIEQEIDPLREYLYGVNKNNLTQSFRLRFDMNL